VRSPARSYRAAGPAPTATHMGAGRPGTVISSTTGWVAGAKFRFACISDAALLHYIEPFLRWRIFGTRPVRTDCCEAGSGPGRLAARGADLIVAVTLPSLPASRADPGPGRLILPLRVNFVANLRTRPEDGPVVSPSERKRQRRRVARYGYRYTISTEPRDFAHFYEHMHVPTMAVRHAERARSADREEAFGQLFRNGFLLLVQAQGTAVAGVLCRTDGQVCHARLVGWLDGDPCHLQREALKTGNHFLLDWARSAGFAVVDFQGCEPFLSKGTFQSKRHLGTTLVLPDGALGAARVTLWAGRDSAAVRRVLAANPVVALDDAGALAAVYFFDAGQPPRLDIPHRCHGLGGPTLVDLDEFTGAAARPVTAREDGAAAPGAR
jgi:hypothetical protein